MGNMKYGTTESGHYEMLDSLPSAIRVALANAEYDYRVEYYQDLYLATGSVVDAVAAIRRRDINHHKQIARRERRTVFGPRSRPISGGRA